VINANLPLSCTVSEIWSKSSYLAIPLAFKALTEGGRMGTISVILPGCQQMTNALRYIRL